MEQRPTSRASLALDITSLGVSMAVPKVLPRWFPLPFLIAGAYIVLLSLGLLPYAPSGRRQAVFDSPQHWQVTSIGVAFFCAGISIILANRGRWLPALRGDGPAGCVCYPNGVVFLFFRGGRLAHAAHRQHPVGHRRGGRSLWSCPHRTRKVGNYRRHPRPGTRR